MGAFAISVILKKVEENEEMSSIFFPDCIHRKLQRNVWNGLSSLNVVRWKWNPNLSWEEKFYWFNAGFCEDLLWTRNSALFGLLDVQHFLFGRFLISRLKENFSLKTKMRSQIINLVKDSVTLRAMKGTTLFDVKSGSGEHVVDLLGRGNVGFFITSCVQGETTR